MDSSFYQRGSVANSKTKKHVLNNKDPVFAEIRDKGFEMVGEVLNMIAVRLQHEEEERHNMTTMELKEFASKLGSIQSQRQSLSIHQKLYEYILKTAADPVTDRLWKMEESLIFRTEDGDFLEFLDDLMSRKVPASKVLRLVCIYSYVRGGLKSKILDNFRRDFLQMYGYSYMIPLQNMLKINLLRKQDSSKNPYGTLMKNLALANDYESSLDEAKVSSAYAGYAPISVRIIQLACQSFEPSDEILPLTWQKGLDTLKILPGDIFEHEKPTEGFKKFSKEVSTLLVFIGGITLAEISAIRCLALTRGIFF